VIALFAKLQLFFFFLNIWVEAKNNLHLTSHVCVYTYTGCLFVLVRHTSSCRREVRNVETFMKSKRNTRFFFCQIPSEATTCWFYNGIVCFRTLFRVAQVLRLSSSSTPLSDDTKRKCATLCFSGDSRDRGEKSPKSFENRAN